MRWSPPWGSPSPRPCANALRSSIPLAWWTDLLTRTIGAERPSAVIDACDQVPAKTALAAWAMRERVALVSVGAAGGKRQAQAMEVADLAQVTHDPLLARLRYNLRRQHAAWRVCSAAKRWQRPMPRAAPMVLATARSTAMAMVRWSASPRALVCAQQAGSSTTWHRHQQLLHQQRWKRRKMTL